MTDRKSRASRDRPSSSSVVPVARQSGSKACGQAGDKAESDNGVLQLERQLAWQHLGQDEDVHFDEGVDREAPLARWIIAEKVSAEEVFVKVTSPDDLAVSIVHQDP